MIGILGGSFDPVHSGHLMMAETARDVHDLDEVWFIPCARQPLKPGGVRIADSDRLELLRLAIAELPFAKLRTDEVDRGGVSYTVDTLRDFRTRYPRFRFRLIIGLDSLNTFRLWKEADEIQRLAELIVIGRPGEPVPAEARAVITRKLSEASSTEIRRRIAAGEPIPADWLPTAAADYIHTHGLYTDL